MIKSNNILIVVTKSMYSLSYHVNQAISIHELIGKIPVCIQCKTTPSILRPDDF